MLLSRLLENLLVWSYSLAVPGAPLKAAAGRSLHDGMSGGCTVQHWMSWRMLGGFSAGEQMSVW